MNMLSDALRKVNNNNFLRDWGIKSREEKLQDGDFKTILNELRGKTLSMYKNTFSMGFAEDVAAMAVKRKNIQRTSFIVFRKVDGCLMFLDGDDTGGTGVDAVDRTHVVAYGIDEDKLLEILDGIHDEDFVTIDEDGVYRGLVRLERGQPNLTEIYDGVFSERRLKVLDEYRSL